MFLLKETYFFLVSFYCLSFRIWLVMLCYCGFTSPSWVYCFKLPSSFKFRAWKFSLVDKNFTFTYSNRFMPNQDITNW